MVDLDYIKTIKEKYEKSNQWAKDKGYTNDEHENKQKENDKKLAEIRGVVLNRIVEIEHTLSIFLTEYFSKDIRPDLYEHIFSKEFFTFGDKIKVFKNIGYHKKEEFGEKYNGLTGILMELNEFRNLIAHGVKFHYTRAEIGYPYSGKGKLLDEQSRKEFFKNFEIALFCLFDLQDKLMNEKFKEEFGRDLDIPLTKDKKS